jgi:hypothetical protein
MHCCPHCSIAWRSGAAAPTIGQAITRSGAALACPDCGDRDLVRMGATAQGEAWRCLACHGQLVRVAASAVSPEPVGDGPVGEFGRPLAEFLVEGAMVVLEGIAGAL